MKIIYIMYNFIFYYNYGRLQLSQNVHCICLLCNKGNVIFVSGQGCRGTMCPAHMTSIFWIYVTLSENNYLKIF